MTERDKSYWIEQAKERLLAQEKAADSGVADLFFLYEEAAAEIETEIAALYGKYAKDNQLTPAEAGKLLSGKEYRVWKKSIEEYIEEVKATKRAAKSSRTLLELNTLTMKSRISRKEQLLSSIYQAMIRLAGDEEMSLEKLFGETLKINYYEGCFRIQKGFGIGFDVARFDEKLVRRVLDYPWSTKTFSTAVWDNVDRLAAVTRSQISLGFAKGSGVQEISRNIRQLMDSGKYAAERLVRTEFKYFANQGELYAYKENGVKKYRFVGGSEGSTASCHCEDWNGEIIPVEEAKAGENFPPLHPNCKCTVVAWFDKSVFDAKPGVQPLKENIKFAEWKKKYVA
ncbi:minor capsid protein [Lachnospiraceae bacterium 54-53]